MTDDFHLFGDPGDGDRPIDPDLALMSAYLARELSPMQVLALEERLATDAAFRAAMQPLLDAWAAPIPTLDGGASRREPALSAFEREQSWRRFVSEAAPAGSISQAKPRRSSMKRAAAVIALVVVPMASFAQAVVYAANNPQVRGHEIAKRIVAPFVRETPGANRDARLPGANQSSPGAPRAREVDTGSLLPVPVAPVFPLESESASRTAPRSAARPVPTTVQGVTTAVQAQVRQPDRARIAAFVKEHQPDVVRGSAKAEYVVMVIDAAERYVWSTFGIGNVMTEVAGDARTVSERNAYVSDNRAEFWGDTLALTAGVFRAQGTDVAGGAARGGGGGGRGGAAGTRRAISDSGWTRRDTGYAIGTVSGRFILADSVGEARLRLQATDSAPRGARGGGGGGARDTTLRARVVEGTAVAGRPELRSREGSSGGRYIVEGFGTVTTSGARPTYKHGFMSTRNPPDVNDAPGLVQPEDGSSGIEGLPSTSVAGAETYHFKAGELAPNLLRIIVVRLTPDAAWTPR